jgi:8-oxo-dGTP pyrophosphatase MutT (NUDIX family)
MTDTPDVVIPQSAAIPYRIEDRSPRILLITNRSRKRWIVPKGIVEEWQSPQEAALEEAFEEAGIRGSLVGGAVGVYEYEKWDSTCRVEVFLMRVEEVLTNWPEAGFRERIWVGVEEALELVESEEICELIQRAEGLMK